jgi:hypothetical protein
MRAAAATQPKGEGFIPITTADIAALAQIAGESAAAKKLFCRGEYAGGPMPAATAASAVESAAPPHTGAKPASQNGTIVPLPPARPKR